MVDCLPLIATLIVARLKLDIPIAPSAPAREIWFTPVTCSIVLIRGRAL